LYILFILTCTWSSRSKSGSCGWYFGHAQAPNLNAADVDDRTGLVSRSSFELGLASRAVDEGDDLDDEDDLLKEVTALSLLFEID
jgi:hypothetical protein